MSLLKFADIKRGKDSSDRVGQFMLASYIILFLVFLVLPLGSLIFKSLQNKDGDFVGLINYYLEFTWILALQAKFLGFLGSFLHLKRRFKNGRYARPACVGLSCSGFWCCSVGLFGFEPFRGFRM